MLADRVGSERALEDAQEAERLAQTALEAAEASLRQIETAPIEADVATPILSPEQGVLLQLHVAHGQMVSAGAPLFAVANLDPVWIRVPVYSGDLSQINRGLSATVKPINASAKIRGRQARPVEAPPSADPLSSTSDLFYQLPNPNLSLRPGERVSVSLPMFGPMSGTEECPQVPWSAILYDINGGTWVYEQIEPLVFARRRVSVEQVLGDVVCLSAGPENGAAVVMTGAAELFGTEFGVGH